MILYILEPSQWLSRGTASRTELCFTVNSNSRRVRAARRSSGGFPARGAGSRRSEEHTSELQSLMRISYAVFCLKNKLIHERPWPSCPRNTPYPPHHATSRYTIKLSPT